jgi:hypothetical protein
MDIVFERGKMYEIQIIVIFISTIPIAQDIPRAKLIYDINDLVDIE